jgi:hypothetical protein
VRARDEAFAYFVDMFSLGEPARIEPQRRGLQERLARAS